jgi:hypothetical protein
VSPKRRPNDRTLDERLEALRREAEADGDFLDVVAVWEAIERTAVHNRRLSEQGEAAHPFPEWINNYLLRSASKIGRLSLGIRPKDDRPIADIGVDNIGELRKVPEVERLRDPRAERLRDKRIKHVASALGFVRKGVTAFQRHDRVTRDADYLWIYDNPDLPRDVRRKFVDHIKKTEHIDTAAVRNRLSKARRAAPRPKRT